MSKIKRVSTSSYVAPATEVNRAIDQINKKFATQTSGLGSKLTLDYNSVGPKVVFTKKNYGSEVDVIIPGILEITRGDDQGLYNSAIENQYNDFGWNGPANTEWNSYWNDNSNYGWRNLTNLSARAYNNWLSAVDGFPPHHVNEEFVMHETTTNRYFLIKFLSWTTNGYGGGFSYERYEVLPQISVVKNDYDDTFVDIVTPGVVELKRDSYGGAIYNRVLENEYNGNNANGGLADSSTSPLGTEWNSYYTDNTLYGHDDVTNVRSRKYSTFYDALSQNVGNNINGTPLIMHDLATDTYHKFYFDGWTTGGNGGGMSYTRQVIPLDQAITFADGTSIKSVNDIQAGTGGGGSQTFNQSLNTGDSVTFNTVNTNGIAAQTLEANSNGQVDNIKIGDDCWIGDGDVANGFVIKGQQAFNQGRIKFGNNPNAPIVGNLGSQHLNISKLDGTMAVPEYADNTAATNAGLAVGDIYRTGDILKIRH